MERFREVLRNPRWEECVEREPLLSFSFYLSGHVAVLCSLADEILENLDAGFSVALIDGGRIDRAESLMWLWLLGAYEIVRTMDQAKPCFSARLAGELNQLKKTLATVRMPAAKMEKAGKKLPVNSNRSPAGLDLTNRDLFVGDPDGQDISARGILSEFDRVFCSITTSDVLLHHKDAY